MMISNLHVRPNFTSGINSACFSYWVSCWFLWPCCGVSLFFKANNLSHGEQCWHYTYCVFVSFSRSQGQTAGRRWVWRVIPLHLSINLETISSVPYRMSKPRWAEDESIIFFLRLSLEFSSKHINTSCAIIFLLPSPPFLSVEGRGSERTQLSELFYAKEKLCLKSTGCDRMLSLSLTSLCMGCDGACARDLLSNRKWDT